MADFILELSREARKNGILSIEPLAVGLAEGKYANKYPALSGDAELSQAISKNVEYVIVSGGKDYLISSCKICMIHDNKEEKNELDN